VNVITTTAQSSIGQNALINTDGTGNTTQDVLVTASDSSTINSDTGTIALGAVAVGGALSVDILRNSASATIGSDAQINAKNRIDVTAETEKHVDAKAVSAAAGGVGMSGSIAVAAIGGDLNDDAYAQINGEDDNGDTNSESGSINETGSSSSVNPLASDDENSQLNDFNATSSLADDVDERNADREADYGVSDDVATSTSPDPRSGTLAVVGSGATLKAGGDLNVTAKDTTTSNLLAGAVSAGSVAGAGAATVTVVANNTEAMVASNAELDSGANLTVSSNNDKTLDAIAASGAVSFSNSIAGSVGVTVDSSTAKAHIDSGAKINQDSATRALASQQNVVVQAVNDAIIDVKTGAVAVSAISGIGGTLNVVTTSQTTLAYIDVGSTGRVSAEGLINVDADSIATSNAESVVGAGGLSAGIAGGTVNLFDDSRTSATIGNASVIDDADEVKVDADTSRTAVAATTGVAAGAVGLGGSLATVDMDGTTTASVAANAKLGSNASIRDLDVNATAKETASATATALAAGLISGSGAFASTSTTSEVTASTGSNSEINASGDVSVTAKSTPSLSAESIGVSVAGGVKIGASFAEAKANQKVAALIGIDNIITADNLLVKATNGLSASGYSVKAKALGAGGGLLLGLNATSGSAENIIDVDSTIGDGSSLTIGNVLTVQAVNNSKQRTEATGLNGGIIAVGFNEAEANSSSDVDAHIGNNVSIAAGDLTINADSTDDNYADSVAGSGGLVSGSASEANTRTVSNTTASMGDGSVDSSIRVDSIDIDARHHSVFNSQVDSTNASLLGASGATARNNSVATVEAKLGSALDIETLSIDVDANNITTKADIWAVTSGSGGLLDAPAASSISNITNNTRVDVGSGTAIVQLGEPSAAGAYEFDALNKVTAKDRVRMNAGGAVALAKGVSIIDANTNNATVNIGDGVTLLAVGDVKVGTRAEADIETKVAVDVYGLAGAPRGESRSSFKLNNQVSIGEDAIIYALKDVRLGAGVSSANEENNIRTKARTDLWNNTIIPINSDPEADAIIQSSNTIIIKDGADVGAVQDAYLLAKEGRTSTSGVGLGKDIYREALAAIASAISNAFGGGDVSFDIHGGSESNISSSIVTVENNAVVRVGTEAKQKLQIDFLDANRTTYKTTRWINDVIVGSDEGIQIIAEDTFSIADDIRRRITELQELISEYSIGTDNSGELAIAILAYENEISFLEQKLEDLGYVPEGLGDDGNFKFTGATTLTELEFKQLQVDSLGEDRDVIVVDRDETVVVRDQAETDYLQLDADKVILDSDKATLDAELVTLIEERDLLDPVDDKDAYDAKDAEVTLKDAEVVAKQDEIDSNVISRTTQFDLYTAKSTEVINLNEDIQGYDDVIDPIQANIDAGDVYGTELPDGPTVTKLTIGDTIAQLGNITIEADRLQGSGTLRAPGDARIDIINNTNNFLELNDLIIPANDGGHVYYNDVDVTNTAQIDAINRPVFGTIVPSSLILETLATSPTPEIFIESNYNPLDASNTSKAAELEAAGIPYANVGPDIIVKAGASPLDQTIISNTRGKVTIDSEAGNIRIERDSKISAATVQIETRSGDFVQSYSDAFSHIAGDPLLPEGTGFSLNTSQGIDPDDGSLAGIIANGSILIAARYLNINGLIQSGIPEWGVNIASDAGAINPDDASQMTFEQATEQYNALENPVEGDQFFDVFGTGTSGLGDEFREINVEFNASEQRLELSGIEVKGGYIDLFGQVMNTGDKGTGKLRVLDGYGQIKVNNESTQNLYVSTLDAGQGVEGKIKITNILGVDAGGKPVVDVQEFTRDGGARTGYTYNPQAGLRYVQSVGTDKTTTIFYKYEEDRLFGISALSLGSDINQYWYDTDSVEDPLSTGEFLRLDTPSDIQFITNLNTSYTTSATQRILGRNGSSCNFLCITTTYYQYFRDVTGTKEIDSYSVKADHEIGIEYIGYDNGVIDVTSRQDVLLAGSLLNRNGNTSVTSTQGSILQTETSAAMGGINVDLNAAESIGDSTQSIILANLDGGNFNATADLGNIFVNQETGDMAIGTVSAAQGKVQLNVDGDITTPTGYIEGRRIDLTSRNGALGGAITPVNVRTGVTTVATEFADYGLVATARGDINIANTGGDLMVVAVESKSGDVTLTTTGKMIDNNLVERVDEDAQTALVALWDEMRLRGSEAADKADEEIILMENSVTAEYQRYWNLREQQAEPSSYDSAFVYLASDAEVDLLTDYYTDQGKSGSEITEAVEKFEQDRTNEYHSLHQKLYNPDSDGAVQGFVAANYDAEYSYEATADEKSKRTDGSSWSDLQLALSVSPGLLKEITDTVPVIKDPNVKGNNVTLVAAEGIGIVDPLDIDLTRGLDALTDAEKAAIAAAERGDTTVVEEVLLDAEDNPVVDDLGNVVQGLLEIAQRKPVNIEQQSITGMLDATAMTGDVYLGSEEDVRIGRIIAGNEIRLKVAGGLESALTGTDEASINIFGERLILEAAKGGIGDADSPIIINLGADAPLTARAAQDIYITEYDGDMNIDTIFSKEGVYLLSDGSIFDGFDSTEMNIRAENITLTAGDAIGEFNNGLDVLNGQDGEIVATSGLGGGIHLNIPNAVGNFGRIDSAGAVTLSAAFGYTVTDAVTALADISLLAGSSVEIESTGSVTGLLGDLQVSATELRIADGAFVDVGIGRIFIETFGDAIVTGIKTENTSVDAVSIVSGGRVLDGGDSRLDIVAASGDAALSIDANGGIGNASITEEGITDEPNPLEINVSGSVDVSAKGEGGGIYIESPDSDLRLSNVTASDTSAFTSAGDILLIQSGEYRSTGGTLAFEAEGSILDESGDSLIEAVDLALQANNGTIGSAQRSIQVDSETISGLSAATGVYLTEVSGDMNIGSLYNGNGEVVLHVAEADRWLNISGGRVDGRMLWTADNMSVKNLVHGGNQQELYFDITSSTGGMADDINISYQSDYKVRFANFEAERAIVLGDVNALRFDRILTGKWAVFANDTTSVYVDNVNSGLHKEYTIQLTNMNAPYFLDFTAGRRMIKTDASTLYYDEGWIVNFFDTQNSLARLVEKDLASLKGPLIDLEALAEYSDDKEPVYVEDDALNMQPDDDSELYLPLYWSDM